MKSISDILRRGSDALHLRPLANIRRNLERPIAQELGEFCKNIYIFIYKYFNILGNMSKFNPVDFMSNLYKNDEPRSSKNPTEKGPETESRKPHNPRLIGQGTYGCVYYDDIILSKTDILSPDTNITKDDRDNPYLYDYTTKTKFKSDTETELNNIYDKMISKFGETEEMNIETESYKQIFDIDPTYRYHYPKPLLISVNNTLRQKLSATLLNPLSTCNVYRSSPASDFSILLMNYGGNDLNKYIKNLISETKTNINTTNINTKQYLQKINIFFKHFKNIIEGINEFSTKNYIHGDLKSANIVYDVNDIDTNGNNPRMKLIDFGISKTFDYFKFNKKNTNNFCYFPPEIILLEIKHFYYIKNLKYIFNEDIKEEKINNFVNNIIYTSQENDPKKWSWYDQYFYFSGFNYFITKFNMSKDYMVNLHKSYFKQCLLNIIEKNISYDDFEKMYFKNVDYYGIGFTLFELLSKICQCFDYIGLRIGYNSEIFDNLRKIAFDLSNFDLFQRNTYVYNTKLIDDYSNKYNELNNIIKHIINTRGGMSTNQSNMSQSPQSSKKSSNIDPFKEIPKIHNKTNKNIKDIDAQIKEIEDQEKEIKINDEVLYYLREDKKASEKNPNHELINEKLSQIKKYMENIPKLTNKKLCNEELTKEDIEKLYNEYNINPKTKSKSISKNFNKKKYIKANSQKGPRIPKKSKRSQGGFRIRRISKTIKKKSPPKTPRKTTSRKTRI